MEIGRAIRIVRQAKRVRISELASKAGISVPFLSLIESGGRQPSIAVVHRVALALGVPSAAFMVLAQPRHGSLSSSDMATARLVDSIGKLAAAEEALRAQLDREVSDETERPHA
jgi:transcriptional regulator with XRE-family HTH domain